MKLNIIDTMLRSTVRFMLPPDCPDSIIDYHYLAVRENLINNVRRTKFKIKSIFRRN